MANRPVDGKKLEEVLDKLIDVLQKKGMLPKDVNREELIATVGQSIEKAGGIDSNDLQNPKILQTLSRALIQTHCRMGNPEFQSNFDLDKYLDLSLKNIRGKELSADEKKELTEQLEQLDILVNQAVARQEEKAQNDPDNSPEEKSENKEAAESLTNPVILAPSGEVLIMKPEVTAKSKSTISALAIEATGGTEPDEQALKSIGFIKPEPGGLFETLASELHYFAHPAKTPWEGALSGPRPDDGPA